MTPWTPIAGKLCPADREKMAEDFVLGRLTLAVAAAFDEHVETCELCSEELCETLEFIEGFHAVGAGERTLVPAG